MAAAAGSAGDLRGHSCSRQPRVHDSRGVRDCVSPTPVPAVLALSIEHCSRAPVWMNGRAGSTPPKARHDKKIVPVPGAMYSFQVCPVYVLLWSGAIRSYVLCVGIAIFRISPLYVGGRSFDVEGRQTGWTHQNHQGFCRTYKTKKNCFFRETNYLRNPREIVQSSSQMSRAFVSRTSLSRIRLWDASFPRNLTSPRGERNKSSRCFCTLPDD